MDLKRGTQRGGWNAIAWFGAQVGSTCWMLFVGISLLGRSRPLAALLLACFVLANGIGMILWMHRGRLDRCRAIQALMLILLVFTAIAMLGADGLGLLRELDPRFEHPRRLYWLLLLFPALMALLHHLNRAKSDKDKL